MPASRKSQQGAVAIMVGFMLFVLIGMLALVVDLGHLYLAKVGLQNGADAAALAGAKALNGTADGVIAAKASAIAVARQNSYSFGSPVGTADADAGLILSVGSCKDDACMEPVDSVNTNILAADKMFFKVETQQRNLTTFFAPLFGVLQTGTFGMAVAGRISPDISPIAICELPDDPTNTNPTELGFERGVSYDVADANPIGPGTLFWIDPVSTLAGTCDGSVPTSLPYVCSGKINFTPAVGSQVYTNTGVASPQLRALDSRFGDYPPSAGCDPATAPADTNKIEYLYSSNAPKQPRTWMEPDPSRQSLKFFPDNTDPRDTSPHGTPPFPVPWNVRTFADYGVLWSAAVPEAAVNDVNDAQISARWTALYHAPANAATGYPLTTGTPPVPFPPYLRDGGNGRRVMNMVILSCTTSGGICRAATVAGVGQFFLQKRTESNHIYVEFVKELDESFTDADIKLFR